VHSSGRAPDVGEHTSAMSCEQTGGIAFELPEELGAGAGIGADDGAALARSVALGTAVGGALASGRATGALGTAEASAVALAWIGAGGAPGFVSTGTSDAIVVGACVLTAVSSP